MRHSVSNIHLSYHALIFQVADSKQYFGTSLADVCESSHLILKSIYRNEAISKTFFAE